MQKGLNLIFACFSCYVAFNADKMEKDDSAEVEPEVPYKLPDGNVIQVLAHSKLFFAYSCVVQIGAEKFRAPEVLFNPSLIGQEYVGVHQCLLNSIAKCDMDIRRKLFSQIILAGGSTMFDGRKNRVNNEQLEQ